MAGNLFLRVRRPAIPPSLDRLILCGGHGSTALGSPIGGCLPFPVSGRVVKTRLVDGSYYAEALSEGFDPAGPDNSQGYITHVASRALIFIEADNPDIGLMVAIFVGMSEVSSNEITVYEGQHVDKGDQLGTLRGRVIMQALSNHTGT